MAKLLRASGEVVEVAPADGRMFTLQELHGFVGGYIEIVRAPAEPFDAAIRPAPRDPRHGWYFVLNEDGKRLRLPVNETATVGYWAAGGSLADHIVGDVVLCTWAELEGDESEADDGL